MSDKDKNKKLFCDSLKYYLSINNKTRKDLSKDLGISYTTICDWVNGNAIPRSQKIEKIAKYFGINVSDLYETHIVLLNDLDESKLETYITKYAKNKFQEELLIKCTLLNLENTKDAINKIDYYLNLQDKENEEFKWLDTYNDKNYDK